MTLGRVYRHSEAPQFAALLISNKKTYGFFQFYPLGFMQNGMETVPYDPYQCGQRAPENTPYGLSGSSSDGLKRDGQDRSLQFMTYEG